MNPKLLAWVPLLEHLRGSQHSGGSHSRATSSLCSPHFRNEWQWLQMDRLACREAGSDRFGLSPTLWFSWWNFTLCYKSMSTLTPYPCSSRTNWKRRRVWELLTKGPGRPIGDRYVNHERISPCWHSPSELWYLTWIIALSTYLESIALICCAYKGKWL